MLRQTRKNIIEIGLIGLHSAPAISLKCSGEKPVEPRAPFGDKLCS